MDTFDTFDDTYLQVDYPMDLEREGGAEPEPPASRKPPKKKKARSDDRATALQHAVTGVAAAGIMTSALSASGDKRGSGRSLFGSVAVACVALGMGALYAGALYFLYRRMAALQASLQETMNEVKKLARMMETSEEIADEPLPVEEVVPPLPVEAEAEEDIQSNYHMVDENGGEEEEEEEIPRVVELPTPPRPGPKKQQAKRVSKKRMSPKEKASVFDLDAVMASAATDSS
jgi:hypothetical protein